MVEEEEVEGVENWKEVDEGTVVEGMPLEEPEYKDNWEETLAETLAVPEETLAVPEEVLESFMTVETQLQGTEEEHPESQPNDVNV